MDHQEINECYSKAYTKKREYIFCFSVPIGSSVDSDGYQDLFSVKNTAMWFLALFSGLFKCINVPGENLYKVEVADTVAGWWNLNQDFLHIFVPEKDVITDQRWVKMRIWDKEVWEHIHSLLISGELIMLVHYKDEWFDDQGNVIRTEYGEHH